ncbi:MAG: nuclear transport factor 2 family protein [Caulobacteraceae bacterium]|nr:nuclear transport factor 2 family protein [Caulobacteraceae bacterium]
MTIRDPAADQAVREVVARRARAVSAKDAAAAAACTAPDFVQYSLAPPLEIADGGRALSAWFETWDGPIGYEIHDLKVTAGQDMAFAHGLVHLTGRKLDGEEADIWFRQTLGLRRLGDAWKLNHEHDSVPFYMDGSLRAAVDLSP